MRTKTYGLAAMSEIRPGDVILDGLREAECVGRWQNGEFVGLDVVPASGPLRRWRGWCKIAPEYRRIRVLARDSGWPRRNRWAEFKEWLLREDWA